MTAPACPNLAAQFYKELVDETDSVDYLGSTPFYLLGAILTGGWVEMDHTVGSSQLLRILKHLPSWPAIKMHCHAKTHTQDELTAALVAIKLST